MWMQVRIWPNTYIFWSFGWHPEVIWRLNLPGYYPVVVTQMCSQKGTSWRKDSLQRGDKPGRNVLIMLVFREPERWGSALGMGVIRDSMVLWALGGSSSSYEKSDVIWKTNHHIFPQDDWPSENTGIKLYHITKAFSTFMKCFQTKLLHIILCNSLYNNFPFKSCFFPHLSWWIKKWNLPVSNSSCIYIVLATYLRKAKYFIQGKVLWVKTNSELIALFDKVHITLLHDQTNSED